MIRSYIRLVQPMVKINGSVRKPLAHILRRNIHLRSLSTTPQVEPSSTADDNCNWKQQQERFLEEYKIRLLLERPIYYYAEKQLPKFSIERLYDQSRKLAYFYLHSPECN